MILSNEGIRQAMSEGALCITPPPADDQYTTSAVDLRLGDDFRRWDRAKLLGTPGVKVELDLSRQDFQKTAKAFLMKAKPEKDGSLVLPPYCIEPCHLLATTHETVEFSREGCLAGRVEGRSSLARLGLIVHLTAPTIHAGFKGHLVLEMINHGPFYLRLVPSQTRICQLIIERLEAKPAGDIRTAFQGQGTAAGNGRT
jgi:dCTP deaminase